MKTAADRLDDTRNYLSNHVTPAQYNEIQNLVAATANKAALSNALSIGHTNPFVTQGRRAKRALMLLAQLLITDLAKRAAETARLAALPEGAEAPLIAEIKSWFVVPGVMAGMVAQHARNTIARMPKWNNVNFEAADAVRGVYRLDKPFNCYNACVFWAFQAGAISKRYLYNELQGTNGNQFFPIYSQVGWDTIIDHTTGLDSFAGGPIVVPAGMTVYFETPYKVFGHVACSLGDGSVISQNSVNIGTAGMNAIADAALKAEFDKMAHAVTHIVDIREMIGRYFNPQNGYPKVKVTRGAFWDPIAQNAR